MKVSLISSTGNAKELLIFTKNTRLNMDPSAYGNIIDMSDEEKQEQIDYVFSTISSTLEFVDYVFLIQDVTRAFTHQLVRHRVGFSFAQQSQRSVDMNGFSYLATGKAEKSHLYHDAMYSINNTYRRLIDEEDVPPQDARGILPTNIMTNIVAKINLRSLSGLMNIRLCPKAQGEFQDVAREMRRVVLEVHPWAEPVLQVNCVQHLTCAFPRYEECPVKEKKSGAGFFNDREFQEKKRSTIKAIWESQRAEAIPLKPKKSF